MAAWYKEAARTYDWACAGGTAAMAVWVQLLGPSGSQKADGPNALGRAAVLLDLVKCFERIRLHHVWRWDYTRGVLRRFLRLICVSYSLSRRILHMGSISDPVETITVIVPGSAFAIAALHMVPLHPCDKVIRTMPVILCKFVYDVTIARQEESSEVVEDLTRR